jgi:Glycosyl transferase family 2
MEREKDRAVIVPGMMALLHPHVLLAVHAHVQLRVCDNVQDDGIRDCDARRAVPLRRVVLVRAIQALAALLIRRPSVTVVTPTWQRRDLLLSRCIPSVRAQCYDGEVRHVIVCDGPDPGLPPLDGLLMLTEHRAERNRGLRARQLGARMAETSLVAYLDDDNAWRPRHLDVLTRALGETGADFAYSRMLRHDNGYAYIVGASPPGFAQVDTSLLVHRRELLDVADWEPSEGPSDWDIVHRWLQGGARWVAVPDITLDYYAKEAVLS